MEVKSELVSRNGQRYLVALMPSASNPSKSYRVDVTNGRCDCPAWKFSRANPDGSRKPCKHLIALGFTPDLLGVPQVSPPQQAKKTAYHKKASIPPGTVAKYEEML